MRENRFRLRSPIDKIVGYEKWFMGSMDSKNFYIAEPCWLYSKDGEFWNPKKIDHRKKDQFTGLKDKNGKEIFEGDIVSWGGSMYGFGKVVYERYSFLVKYKLGEVEDEMYFNHPDAYTIIGNIYENPELLTTPK